MELEKQMFQEKSRHFQSLDLFTKVRVFKNYYIIFNSEVFFIFMACCIDLILD